jgi:hypothetical protein
MGIFPRPVPLRPFWRNRSLSGPRLGQAAAPVRCCPNPNASPGQEMPCYDADGNILYYTASQSSWGQCAVPTEPPPPAEGQISAPPPASAPPGAPNMLVENPPAKVSFPIENMTFPSGMEEPPIQPFTQLPPGTQMAPRPKTVYPVQAEPPPPYYPPGTPIPVQDWFGLCKSKGSQALPQPPQ